MEIVDQAIKEIETLLKVIKRVDTLQVRSNEQKGLIKATSLTWFKNIRPNINLDERELNTVDEHYKSILEASERATTKSKYLVELKILRKELIRIRSENILEMSTNERSNDIPPNFDSLIQDAAMRNILIERWDECLKCINADAPLSSVVMMGGLLETIFLARVNHEQDKNKIFKSSSAPIDNKTNRVLELKQWTLKNYIEVSHEINWISQSVRDIGEVLRDYRNYIHPYKQFSHNIKLVAEDARIFWEITKSLIKQLLSTI